MKVQQIKQSVSLENLEDWGSAGLPRTTPIKVSGVQRVIKGSEAIDTGIFRVHSGDVSALGEAGGSHAFPGGRGRFTADGADTIHFTSGDTLFFEANTEGVWEVEEAMRKVYVIF
jgi:uncharacterized cupin superfamily protein